MDSWWIVKLVYFLKVYGQTQMIYFINVLLNGYNSSLTNNIQQTEIDQNIPFQTRAEPMCKVRHRWRLLNCSSLIGRICNHSVATHVVTQEPKEAVKPRWRSAMKQEIYSVFSKSPHLRASTGACMSEDKWETYSETEDRADIGKDTGGTCRDSLRGGGRGSRALLGRFTNLDWNKTRQLFLTRCPYSFLCFSSSEVPNLCF